MSALEAAKSVAHVLMEQYEQEVAQVEPDLLFEERGEEGGRHRRARAEASCTAAGLLGLVRVDARAADLVGELLLVRLGVQSHLAARPQRPRRTTPPPRSAPLTRPHSRARVSGCDSTRNSRSVGARTFRRRHSWMRT